MVVRPSSMALNENSCTDPIEQFPEHGLLPLEWTWQVRASNTLNLGSSTLFMGMVPIQALLAAHHQCFNLKEGVQLRPTTKLR